MRAPDWLVKEMMVEVDWIDITEDDDVSPDKVVEPVECWTVARVDTWDEKLLTVVKERRGEVVDKQVFPWGVITNVWQLLIGGHHAHIKDDPQVTNTPERPSISR